MATIEGCDDIAIAIFDIFRSVKLFFFFSIAVCKWCWYVELSCLYQLNSDIQMYNFLYPKLHLTR